MRRWYGPLEKTKWSLTEAFLHTCACTERRKNWYMWNHECAYADRLIIPTTIIESPWIKPTYMYMSLFRQTDRNINTHVMTDRQRFCQKHSNELEFNAYREGIQCGCIIQWFCYLHILHLLRISFYFSESQDAIVWQTCH